MSGKYNSFCALINPLLRPKPCPDGKDNSKNKPRTNEIWIFFLKIIPLSAVYPMQYYIDFDNYAIILWTLSFIMDEFHISFIAFSGWYNLA